MLKALKIFKTL